MSLLHNDPNSVLRLILQHLCPNMLHEIHTENVIRKRIRRSIPTREMHEKKKGEGEREADKGWIKNDKGEVEGGRNKEQSNRLASKSFL